MRSLRMLIGLPVVVRQKRAGRVLQAELTEDLTRLKGIWMDAGFRGTRFIPSESLSILGRASVLSDEMGKRRSDMPGPLLRRATGLDGERLGVVTGAAIDEISFCVESIELSGSLWDDLLHGRRLVRTFTLNRENGDVIIDVAQAEKEAKKHEERHGQGTDHRCDDRRLCSNDVWHHELADRTPHERQDEEDWTLDRR